MALHWRFHQVFSQNLEKAVIETIEAGHMTKDLAICVHGWNVTEDQYLMTEPFMDEIKVSPAADFHCLPHHEQD